MAKGSRKWCAGRCWLRTRDDLIAELESLLQQAYYAEDFELLWALKGFVDRLTTEERQSFEALALFRLREEPSIVNVMICSVLQAPEAVPILVSTLEAQPRTSLLTRALITTLGRQGDPSAYGAVERFLDSDQEGDALAALASLDFRRALFHVLRYARRGRLVDHGLHILHDRKKRVGLGGLAEDLQSQAALVEGMPDCVRILLDAKQGDYNPFPWAEREWLIARLTGAA